MEASIEKGDGRMGRTAFAAIAFAWMAYAAARWVTYDFQVWTAEGARRLEVTSRAVPAPPLQIIGPDLPVHRLDQLLSHERAVTIVDFMYTRCITVCSALGGVFTQLQASIAEGERQHRGAPVRLLSISFDSGHDDSASLGAYASGLRADPNRWRFARAARREDEKRMFDAYGVTVIPDGFGGYEHNAALLVVDRNARLVRIFDYDEPDAALVFARALANAGEAQ